MQNLTQHWRKVAVAALLPVTPSHDIVSKDIKTSRSFERHKEKNSTETGADRLRAMFTIDEFGRVSSEVNSIYQSGFIGFLVGAIYGGVLQSRGSYLEFMENNEATAFKSHLDAKRKLQDQVTMSFAKGAFRWGWRMALFTSSYVGITTCVSVYRGKSSMYEYVSAGTLTGMLYKINLGLRGMAVGGLLGCTLGGIAGGLSLVLLKASGTTMEEVRYWQYQWKEERDAAFQEGVKNCEEVPAIVVAHNEKVGTDKITLDDL